MTKATTCTVYEFPLEDKPGVLLAFANRLRTADIALKALWAHALKDETSTIRCIAERNPQFRDFVQSTELVITEEKAIYVSSVETGGAFLRLLEKVAGADININSIHAVSLAGETGWVIWTDEANIDPLMVQLSN